MKIKNKMLTARYLIKTAKYESPQYTVRDHLSNEYYTKRKLEKSKRQSKLEEKSKTQKLNN